jgi:hypothetical protein
MEYLYEYLVGPLLIAYLLYKQLMYIHATKKFLRATGVVVDYVYYSKRVSLLITFSTNEGSKIEFEENPIVPFFVESRYPLDSEVEIFYSPTSPDVAMINSSFKPVTYLTYIALLIAGYFYWF